MVPEKEALVHCHLVLQPPLAEAEVLSALHIRGDMVNVPEQRPSGQGVAPRNSDIKPLSVWVELHVAPSASSASRRGVPSKHAMSRPDECDLFDACKSLNYQLIELKASSRESHLAHAYSPGMPDQALPCAILTPIFRFSRRIDSQPSMLCQPQAFL